MGYASQGKKDKESVGGNLESDDIEDQGVKDGLQAKGFLFDVHVDDETEGQGDKVAKDMAEEKDENDHFLRCTYGPYGCGECHTMKIPKILCALLYESISKINLEKAFSTDFYFL